MTILVVHFGGIGDFLLGFPAFAALSKNHKITFAGKVDRMNLARAAGIADDVMDINALDFGSLFMKPSKHLVSRLGAYDRVLIWMQDSDGALQAKLAADGVRAELFAGLPPTDWQDHASAYYLRCLNIPEPETCVWTTNAVAAPDVLLHPGSGSATKNWPLPNYVHVSEWVQQRGLSVGWLLGPAEKELAAALPENALSLAPDTLVGAAELLKGTQLYVGNDSGISHLAGAMGVRTVAIFSPTNPRIWAPLGPHVEIAFSTRWPNRKTVQRLIAKTLAFDGH